MQNAIEDGSRRISLERQEPGGHFVQQNPEREQVRPSIKWFAKYLFRRHVDHCSQRRSRTGEMLLGKA